ncbi:hypothetical protein [uncultured Methanomethylovorans sp.]|uniref:hypothetical protein n=1 Tax=uncultured Methanomethylovorans sp. TaxID=183759 RepID=UPI003748CE29
MCPLLMNQLLKETGLCENYHGITAITREEAQTIAKDVERRILKVNYNRINRMACLNRQVKLTRPLVKEEMIQVNDRK